MVANVCGGVTTNINIHQINSSDLTKAEALGFANVDTLKEKENLGYSVLDCKK